MLISLAGGFALLEDAEALVEDVDLASFIVVVV